MNVTYLDVPFSEKDEAKALGAWWDPEVRKWFVPHGKPVHAFGKWLPEAECVMNTESKTNLENAESKPR